MTDESFARLYAKKILTFDQFKTQLLDFFLNEISHVFSFDFPLSGMGTGGNQMPVVRASSSVINIGATGGPFLATDGKGHIFSLANADARLQGVHLPTGLADGVVLSLGLERALFDQSPEINVRTQKAVYRKQTEGIGRRGAPDAVVDNGNGTLTFTVDAVTEAGVSHAGRTVTVWLKPLEDGGAKGPQSAIDATAIETRTVAFTAGSNQITTAAQFGQVGLASVVASDYVIVLNGPTVRKKLTEDLSATAGCLFLGTATATGGDAANAIDTSGQTLLIGAGELTKALKRGPHGGLKVRVVSDAADSGVHEMEVVGTDGSTVKFYVDETGHVHATGLDVTGANNVSAIATQGTGTGAGIDATGGATGRAIVSHAVAASDLPQYVAKDSAGNARAYVDHTGYLAGPCSEYVEMWPAVLTSSAASGNFQARNPWSWSQSANASLQIGSPAGSLFDTSSIFHGFGSGVNGNYSMSFGAGPWLSPKTYSSIAYEFEAAIAAPANTTFAFGLAEVSVNATSTGPSNAYNWVAIGKRSADANWQAIVGDGTTLAYYDLGVTATAATRFFFRIELHGSGSPYGVMARFLINGTPAPTNSQVTVHVPSAASLASFQQGLIPVQAIFATGASSGNLNVGAIRCPFNRGGLSAVGA